MQQSQSAMQFYKQFLQNLTAEAAELGLTVKRKDCPDYIELAIAHGDPDARHSPGVMFVTLECSGVVIVTSLTANLFGVHHDYFTDEDYMTDHYAQAQYPKTQLKKAGWRKCRNKNGEWFMSRPFPEFKLAWFENWIGQTAELCDSIQQTLRSIKKQNLIARLREEREQA